MAFKWLKDKKQKTGQNEAQLFTQHRVSSSLNENIERIKDVFGESDDLVIREIKDGTVPCAVFFIAGLVDEKAVDEHIISPLLTSLDEKEVVEEIPSVVQRVEAVKIQPHVQTDGIVRSVLIGDVGLFIAGSNTGYTLSVAAEKGRNVEEPMSQTIIRGPREGFVENIDTNLGLIRKKICHPSLRFKKMTVGKMTQTKLALAYIHHTVDKDVLHEVEKRLRNVKTDKILDSGMLEELIEDRRYTPFPTIRSTERPDVAASDLVGGKVVIVVDGTPFVLIVPVTFISFFQASEDYYQRYDIMSFIRLLRVIAFYISLALPASYIAVTTFHPELLPTELLVSLLAQREGVPFPAFLEALVMEFVFEILREAGVRMPRTIGPAVSIVGAIVIGESAVRAGLVSSAIVIVVSLTAIASFVIPYYGFGGSVRLLRFLLIVLAGTLGLFGLIVFFIALIIHLCSLSSMGQPYMTPFAPLHVQRLKDTFIRFPLWWGKRQTLSQSKG